MINIEEEEMIELLMELNSPEFRVGADKVVQEKLWKRFREELNTKLDAVSIDECKAGNLPVAIMVNVAADERVAVVMTLTYKRNGGARFMPIYQISSDGLEPQEFEVEIETAAKRLCAFCRKAVELDGGGALFTRKQDLFQPSIREEAVAHLFEMELKHFTPEKVRTKWKKLEPNMSDIACAPFLINGKEMLVVAIRVLNSLGQPDQYPIAYYSFSGLDKTGAINSGVQDAARKITIALEKKTYFNQ